MRGGGRQQSGLGELTDPRGMGWRWTRPCEHVWFTGTQEKAQGSVYGYAHVHTHTRTRTSGSVSRRDQEEPAHPRPRADPDPILPGSEQGPGAAAGARAGQDTLGMSPGTLPQQTARKDDVLSPHTEA